MEYQEFKKCIMIEGDGKRTVIYDENGRHFDRLAEKFFSIYDMREKEIEFENLKGDIESGVCWGEYREFLEEYKFWKDAENIETLTFEYEL